MTFESYNFLRNVLKELKFKYYTKSLFASTWQNDPRCDLLSDFPPASANSQLADRRPGGLAIVVPGNLHDKSNQQR